MSTNTIQLRNSAAAMVDAYQEAKEEIRQAYVMLQRAHDRLSAAFDDQSSAFTRFEVLPTQYSLDIKVEVPKVLQPVEADGYTVQARVKCAAWRVLSARLEMRNLMSSARADELEDSLRDADRLPDVSHEAIAGMIESLTANLGNYVSEAVTEVFEFLRPPRSKLKTNTEFEVGERVILHAFSPDKWIGRPRIDYHWEQEYRNLDNVFHLLDGRGPVKGESRLIAAIRNSTDFGALVETEYFAVKLYRNGRIHIRFKRMDLVARLNETAGGARLKGGRGMEE